MKATTFVLRQHDRIGVMVDVLERERHLRAPMLAELVEEVLSFLALEEDLFYPRLASRLEGDREVHALVRDLHHRISEEHDALLDLVASSELEFRDRLARRDRAIVPILERELADHELEEIGGRMTRFYRESLGAAPEPDVTIH
jgi:hypothetical protein